MCAGAGTSVSSKNSVNSSNHSGKGLAIGLPMFDCYRSSHFCFGFLVNRASFLVPESSPRSVAGLEDVLDKSCGNDVEDDLAPEFDDNPRDNKRYDIFSLALDLLPLFGQVWL